MSNETSETAKAGQSSVIFLAFFYAAISLVARDLTFIPSLEENITFRLGIFVPALAAIVFGPLIGGLTAGVGNLLFDMYVIFEQGNASFKIEYLFGAIANFLGGFVVGWVAQSFRRHRADRENHLVSWKYLIPYTIASIIGLAIVTGMSVGFGIIYFYFEAPLTAAITTFLDIFFVNTAVIVVFVPISIAVYFITDTFLRRRFRNADIRNRTLHIENRKNGVKVVRVEMPDHSLWINQWNPLEMEIENNLSEPSIFQFEAVSTCKIYPQIDRTYRLGPNEKFIQTFYIMPHEQAAVRIRLRVEHLEKVQSFKTPSGIESVLDITGSTLRVRSTESLSQFSSVNILVFIISILWSNIAKFINSGLSTLSDNLLPIVLFVVIEAVLFIPFVYFQVRRLRQLSENQEKLELSFTSDLSSHNYGQVISPDELSNGKSKGKFVILLTVIRLLLIVSIGILTYESYQVVYLAQPGVLGDYILIPAVASLLFGIILEIYINSYINRYHRAELALLESGKVIMKFEPEKPFKINEPNEVTIEAVNPLQSNGIRLQFQSVDTISPSRLELHLAPNETATFKIAVTPLETGLRELLAIAYPLFLEDGSLIGFEESEPMTYQKVDYSALGFTILGMTQQQFETLKNIATFGTILATALVTINQYLQIDNIILKFRDSIPILAILQIPFVYAYFALSNRFRQRFNL